MMSSSPATVRRLASSARARHLPGPGLWRSYTAKTDRNPKTMQLRELSEEQRASAIRELIALTMDATRRQP